MAGGLMLNLTVNGKQERLERAIALVEFLKQKQVFERRIAVGINGEVVHRDVWETISLKEGDVVDIVQMVGGGC